MATTKQDEAAAAAVKHGEHLTGFSDEQIATIRAQARKAVDDAPPVGEMTSSRLMKMLSSGEPNSNRRLDAAG